jgi:hypothetical protein
MAWHDRQTNKRGKILVEYIICKNLYIMNEESEQTSFQSRRGSSNIDLTIVNNHLLSALKNWIISKEESCSNHNIIKFDLRQNSFHDTENIQRTQVCSNGNLKKFDNNISRIVATKFRTEQAESPHLDKILATQAKEANNIERAVDIFQEALILSCNKSLKNRSETKRSTNQFHGGQKS